jgi:ankyrin repeat protein
MINVSVIQNVDIINYSKYKEQIKPIHLACMNGDLDIVKTLISSKVDLTPTITSGGEKNVNCLHLGNILLYNKLAAGYGFENIVGLLIDNGMDVKKETSLGSTAMHFALKRLKLDVIKYLTKRGIYFKFNFIGINSDQIAFQYAIQTGDTKILDYLNSKDNE